MKYTYNNQWIFKSKTCEGSSGIRPNEVGPSLKGSFWSCLTPVWSALDSKKNWRAFFKVGLVWQLLMSWFSWHHQISLAFFVTIPTFLCELCVTVFKKCHLACVGGIWTNGSFQREQSFQISPTMIYFHQRASWYFMKTVPLWTITKNWSIDWTQLS